MKRLLILCLVFATGFANTKHSEEGMLKNNKKVDCCIKKMNHSARHSRKNMANYSGKHMLKHNKKVDCSTKKMNDQKECHNSKNKRATMYKY